MKETRLVEKTEAHVIVRLVLLLSDFLLGGLGGGTGVSGSGDGGSGGERFGVGDSFLDLRGRGGG